MSSSTQFARGNYVQAGDGWKPAFKGYIDDQRVLQVRPDHAGQVRVRVRIEGAEQEAGTLSI